MINYSNSSLSALQNKIHNPIFPIVRDFGFFVFIPIYIACIFFRESERLIGKLSLRFFIPLSRKIIQTAEVLLKKHAIYIACIFFRESEHLIGNFRIDGCKKNHHIGNSRIGNLKQNHYQGNSPIGNLKQNHHQGSSPIGNLKQNHAQGSNFSSPVLFKYLISISLTFKLTN